VSKSLTPRSIKKIEGILVNKIWKRRKLNQKSLRKTFEEIKPIGNYGSNLTFRDFFDGLTIYSPRKKDSAFTKTEFQKQIKNYLLTVFDFEFFVPIQGLRNFPNGLKIGSCKTMCFSKIPLTKWISRGVTPSPIDPATSLLKHKKDDLFLHFKIKSIGFENAQNHMNKAVEQDLHILRYLFHDDITFANFHYLINSGSKGRGSSWHYKKPQNLGGGYSPRLRPTINTLTNIFINSNPTELEERIRKAVTIVSISEGIR